MGKRCQRLGLNCLSAGSVSLTSGKSGKRAGVCCGLNCLSAGSVSLTPYCLSARPDAGKLVSIAFRLGLFL